MPGITVRQVSDKSVLRLRRELFLFAKAATTNAIVASVDPSGVAVGTALTLVTEGLTQLRYPRKITLTLNDDDGGGGLAATVLLVGTRLGKRISETLSVVCVDTNDTTATSTLVYDQVLSATLTSKTADSGDALFMGYAGSALGLPFRINNITDVKSIVSITGTTAEQVQTAVSASSVDVANSAIIGLTTAATTSYEVLAVMDGDDEPGMGDNGVFA